VPPTSTKRRAESRAALAEDAPGSPLDRVRRRIQQGYYDRPEVRRILATLILRRAVRNDLIAK
jgi:hypothetical protein